MRVAKAHSDELIAGPLVGTLHVGRSGETFADRIHQAGSEFHDFGIAETVVADAGNGFEVDLFLGLGGGNEGENQR
jgi:hypothetical protein